MDNKNTLQITAQYPAERYNLLVPMQTVAEIAEIHKPVMNAVQISTNEADKEIYLQDRSKAKADGWALTKKGLNKLMRAAGIKILGTRPIIPSTCQKCAEVNKSIGRPVNCGTCGNKDVKFEARISVPQLTGENIEIVAHKEIIVDDVSVGMTEFQKKEFLKFRSEMCETKAINRALRAAMHIKGTYSLAVIGAISLLGVVAMVFLLTICSMDDPDEKETHEKQWICALTNEHCIFTVERGTCNGCPILEEAEKIGNR